VLVEIVRVDDPELATEVGTNTPDAPEGSPVIANVTVSLNLFTPARVAVNVV
jgi:hypothetical protein